MDIKIYFSIITNNGTEIGVDAEVSLSGKYIPADFNHDIEDDRECLVNKILFTDEDGEEIIGSEKLKEIVYEHVCDKGHHIYKNEICISDFKSDLDYAELI